MGDRTHIEWTDATWNPIAGCAVVSPGCTNCYAMRQAGTRMAHMPLYAGLTQPTKAGPVWTGEMRFNDAALDRPLRWRRPRRIFVNSMSDLFGPSVPDEWIDRIFAVMNLARRHTFQVLTKRPARMRDYLSAPELAVRVAIQMGVMLAADVIDIDVQKAQAAWPLPNVWLGVSVEDQPRADERIPVLIDTPAVTRFLSCEPLLGEIDLTGWLRYRFCRCGWLGPLIGSFPAAHPRCPKCGHVQLRFDWVIVGGESGPQARPMHPDWVRTIRDDCEVAGVPFFFKQWGEWVEVDDGLTGNRTVEPGSDEALAMLEACEHPAWIDRAGVVYRDVAKLPADVPCRLIERLGKKRAGRLLDGGEWLAWPVER